MTLTLNDPHKLRTASIQEVAEAARAVETWTEQDARMLDQGLRSHVLEALLGCTDPKDLHELRNAVVRLLPLTQQKVVRQLDRDWIERWSGWAALLDMRAAQLRDQTSSKDIHHLKHVPEILELVEANEGLTQADIGETLGLSAPNVTRLLRILEDHQRVHRRKEGTAKRVFLSKPCLLPSLEKALRRKGKQIDPAVAAIVDDGVAA